MNQRESRFNALSQGYSGFRLGRRYFRLIHISSANSAVNLQHCVHFNFKNFRLQYFIEAFVSNSCNLLFFKTPVYTSNKVAETRLFEPFFNNVKSFILLNILSQFLISHVLGDRIYSFNVACKLQWIFLCTRKLKYKNKQNQEKRQKIVKEI
jgi:hypothetical protein